MRKKKTRILIKCEKQKDTTNAFQMFFLPDLYFQMSSSNTAYRIISIGWLQHNRRINPTFGITVMFTVRLILYVICHHSLIIPFTGKHWRIIILRNKQMKRGMALEAMALEALEPNILLFRNILQLISALLME